MIKILVFGMPRSGTSFVSKTLSQLGYDFVANHETVDKLYIKSLNKDGYFQTKIVHDFLINSDVKFFDEKKLNNDFINKNFNKTFKNLKCNAIKDPYLLYLVPKILKDLDQNILCIFVKRNKKDTLNSIKNFTEQHGYIYDEKQFSLYYDNYYNYFYKIKNNIKNCIIFDYDKKKIIKNSKKKIFFIIIIIICLLYWPV